MVRRYNRLLVALHVAADSGAGIAAFLLAYWVRFHSGLIAVTQTDDNHREISRVLNALRELRPPEQKGQAAASSSVPQTTVSSPAGSGTR